MGMSSVPPTRLSFLRRCSPAVIPLVLFTEVYLTLFYFVINTTRSTLLMVFTCIILILELVCVSHVWLRDPGYHNAAGDSGSSVATNHHCVRCRQDRPPRCHHCRHCDRCVLRYDHHCTWVNNCVGLNNTKEYFLCMVYSSVLHTEYYVCAVMSLVSTSQHSSVLPQHKQHHVVAMLQVLLVASFTLVLIPLSALCYAFVVFTLRNIVQGVTTYDREMMRRGGEDCDAPPRNTSSDVGAGRSWLRNMCSVMGPVWSWPLPILGMSNIRKRSVE